MLIFFENSGCLPFVSQKIRHRAQPARDTGIFVYAQNHKASNRFDLNIKGDIVDICAFHQEGLVRDSTGHPSSDARSQTDLESGSTRGSLTSDSLWRAKEPRMAH